MRIAIVGFGIAGASVLIQLSKQYQFNPDTDRVDIYESRPRLGAGMPYAEDDDAIVINSFPKSLTLNDDDSEDFIKWMNAHYPDFDVANEFAPRTIYGAYVNERVTPYLEQDYVRLIPAKVADFQVVNSQGQAIYHRPLAKDADPLQYQVFSEALGWSKNYDAVFFAVGHPPYKDPYKLQGTGNFIHNPYPFKTKLADVDNYKRIGIVGSGLTTIDLINFFVKHDLLHDRVLNVYFRHQPFHAVIQPETTEEFHFTIDDDWIAAQRVQHNGSVPIAVVIDQVKKNLLKNGIDYHHVWDNFNTGSVQTVTKAIRQDDEDYRRFQGFFRSFYSVQNKLMGVLNQEDKAYYAKDMSAIMLMIYLQVPKQSISMILELLQTGQLKLINGLTAIEPQADGDYKVVANGIHHQSDLLINATGFDGRLSHVQKTNTLLGNLYRRNLIISDQADQILATYPSAQPMNPNFYVLNRVYFLGYWISSTQGGNTSVALTKSQARVAVADFIAQSE
ncbi:hypothetical protein EF384_07915 [Aerococcus agrisoli]|uniref:FAD-dependent urate hydroxylase HpyO/Asp monooxygenase CreE-like FAD/NAD(P)-binding domain-containing protein n=1 Tax=Aerococcus agrisoli TaxID=2487350 RepID=A0A3N4GEW6_9LACT|nr:FAD/NAD(P)-binding protein [Aerococcus agrisoli]RPA57591.1 hypothetical protein EF384_07915 [Aerococcus agrisoli]